MKCLKKFLPIILSVFLLTGCGMNSSSDLSFNDNLDVINSQYTDKIFDSSKVHQMNITVDTKQWQYMLDNALNEAYIMCSIDYDDYHVDNVGIRPKGNSSLNIIDKQKTGKFNFKLEFDHFKEGQTLCGLDKMSLNNFFMDPTCMKDYTAFKMLNSIDVPSPLTSYVFITLNGEDFGLYLALETPEKSFAQRCYGNIDGNFYKPDLGFENLQLSINPSMNDEAMSILSGSRYSDYGKGERIDALADAMSLIFKNVGTEFNVPAGYYVDDSFSSYKCIFDAAVFTPSFDDKKQYISAIKQLSQSSDRSLIDTENLLRYFAVNSFVDNYDSYNSLFAHNFYFSVQDGKISIVPWDYNTAFGGLTYNICLNSIMQPYSDVVDIDFSITAPNAMTHEVSSVNYPIDTPYYGVDGEKRPMLYNLIDDPYYLQQYHDYISEFLDEFFGDGKYESFFNETKEMITPYIKAGNTIYTYEQFDRAANTLHDYCLLRRQSVELQLDGALPTTFEGQKNDYSNLVQTGDLQLINCADYSCIIPAMTGLEYDGVADIAAIVKKYLAEDEHTVTGLNKLFYDKERSLPMFKELLKLDCIKRLIIENLGGFICNFCAFVLLCIALFILKRYKRRW